MPSPQADEQEPPVSGHSGSFLQNGEHPLRVWACGEAECPPVPEDTDTSTD